MIQINESYLKHHFLDIFKMRREFFKNERAD